MKASLILVGLTTSWVTVLAAPSAAHADHPYTVAPGDDCISIAIKQLGSRAAIPALHQANPQLGAMPHKLNPGQVLTIPDVKNPSDAKLSATRGAVKVREPANPSWNNGQRGMELFRAWRVNTQTQASAEITFRNNSQIDMREDTVVIIYGAEASKTRIDSAEVQLESGALRARLGELSGKKTATSILTPSSGITGLGAEFLIAVNRAGMSTIANHGQAPVAVRGVNAKKQAAGKPVVVAQNMGTRVEVGKAPEKPRPLPATPLWSTAPGILLGTPTATVRGQWTAVATAAKYRIELADSNQSGQVTILEVPATASTFEIPNLAAGSYGVRIAAIDADGLESKASAQLQTTVEAVTAPWQVNNGQAQLSLGSTLTVPAGQACQLDQQPVAAQISIATPGPHILQCGASKLPFSTPAVTVALRSPSTLTTGQRGDLAVEVTGPLHGALSLRSADATMVIANQQVAGNVLTAQVTATTSGAIRVYANEIAVGDVTVAVAAAPVVVVAPVPPSPVAAAAPRFEAGFGLGAQGLLRGRDQLAPSDLAGQYLTRGVALHGNFVVLLPYRLGVELDAAVVNLATRPRSEDAQLLTAGLHLAVRPLVTSRLEVRLLGGATVRTALESNDADAALSVGAAVLSHLTPHSGVRIDVRDLLVSDRTSGLAHRGELLISLYARFGK